MEGIVIKSTGSWYEVHCDDRLYRSRIVGKLRLADKTFTNPVGVGDRVLIEPEPGTSDQAIITEVLDRKNYVVRQSPRQKHQMHLIAANIDQAIVLVTAKSPELKPGFIDRYLLMTEPQDIPAIIVFNKVDIYDDEAWEKYQYFEEIYTDIGYPVLAVSAEKGNGMTEISALLSGKTTLIGGQSGVGKSTLISALFPQLDLRTGDISSHTGKGTHTTTFAQMFAIDAQGYIIDTPGIKTLSYNNLEKMDVAHNFREFFTLSGQCRFGGSCTHTSEPGCEVIAAVEAGTVSPYRYQTYLAILDEIDSQNYWERKN